MPSCAVSSQKSPIATDTLAWRWSPEVTSTMERKRQPEPQEKVASRNITTAQSCLGNEMKQGPERLNDVPKNTQLKGCRVRV